MAGGQRKDVFSLFVDTPNINIQQDTSKSGQMDMKHYILTNKT